MINAVKTVLSEIWQNRYRLFRLANYDLKSRNNATMFGFFWNFLNPALQIFVYWFVFAIGLKSGNPQGDYPYIIWMIVGIIPWFYISEALMGTSSSIYSYSGILKRMHIPLAIVPIKTVLSALISHLWSMLVVFLLILASGYKINSHVYLTIYYLAGSFLFLSGYALTASAITVVFRDYQKIMASVIRLLFYVTPVVWVQDRLPAHLRFILKLNPCAYLIDGYRDSILYGRDLMWHWKQGVYFWIFSIVLFVFGCCVHMKFRERFIDLI